jgi:long-chain acyl-CoA synthetase
MPNFGAPLPVPVDVGNILGHGLALWPDSPALVTADGQWSWRALEKSSDAQAAHLLSRGLAPGDRVASLLPNSATLVVQYLAMLKAGLVGVPLNYRYTPVEIDHALEVSGARAIVYTRERRGDITESRLASRLVRIEIDVGAETPNTPEAHFPQARRAPSDPAFIFFTSGSTGPAKGVTHTIETLGWLFANQAEAYQVTPEDIVLPSSSASHIGGFLMIFATLARGARLVLPRVGDMPALLTLMRAWSPTVFQMPPAALFQFERDDRVTDADFESFRLVLSGGDKVPAQLADEFQHKTGLAITEIYGMTEDGLSHINVSANHSKRGAVGRTAPGFMASIRDDAGNEVAPGTEGTLWVKFKGIAPYYWNDSAATDEVWHDGWFNTGDVMQADHQGYFRFCGRRKQIIVHDASNIFPQEVEDALLQHDAVALVGVIGIHNLVHGENVRAYVTIKNGAERPSAQELIVFARERVGYKAPEEIVFLDEMPLTPSGKVDRTTLKRSAEEAHASP